VPGNARATIQYERKESKVRDCPLTASDRRDPDGPGQLVLSRSESLLVRVGKTSAEVEIPLTFDSFRFGRTELRIRDVQVNRLSVKAAIASSDALAAMGKSALQKIVTDMRFTKDFSPDREK
jgi:hypothetical protein